MPRCFCQIYTHNNLTLSYYIPTVDIGFIGHVSYCHRHYTHNGRRLYRPYPIHWNGMGVMPMNDMNVFLLLLIVLVILLQKK